MIESSKLAQLFKDNPRRGQEIFPELIKKLIIASANSGLTSLRFPSGDSIWTSSFDGYVTGIITGDNFLPSGNSIWEVGTNKDYKTKIKRDYITRTEEAVFFDKSEYTFIVCTPFIFDGNILSSENNMQNDRIWKTVKIYDAEIITDWLNKHIEVILWLYKKFNDYDINLSISTAENTLASYLNMTKPQFTHDIILCSQNNNEGNQIEAFKENLKSQERDIFVLFSPVSIEHGALFSLSVISNDQSLFEKTIVVENIESLSFIENNFSDKIVIINFYWSGIGLRLSKNRYIYIVTDDGKKPLQKLNNIRFDDFRNNLEKMGFDAGESYNITEKTNRNISCLKRVYATNPLLKIPTWAQDAQRSTIIPIALVYEFDKRFYGDIETVNQLYNNSDYINILESQKLIDESPIFHLDNLYRINYKEEVLFTLNINNEDSYVKKLETIFKNIIGVADPIYLQDLKQWDFRKTNHKYSVSLIRGIIETFIILVVKKPSCQLYYNHFVESILKDALNDFIVLNTVIVHLSLLAELSPKAVLKFIDDAIDEKNGNFKKSFETEYGMSVIHDKSKFYDYKFAIDKCLYNKDTALDALRLIFKLYNSDYQFPKNFKIKDYVIESFCPLSYFVIPVKPRDKFKLLKSLISDDNKEKSLGIVESFINGKINHFMIGTPVFKYRENPEKLENDIKEIFELNHEAILYLLDNVEDKLPLYEDLIDEFTFYEKKTIEFIFDKIAEDIKTKDEVFKSSINYAILDRIYDIRRFVDKSQNDSWRYQAQYLDQLIELYNMSISSNPYYKYRYLFVNTSYDMPYLNPSSWDSSEQEPDYLNKEREKRAQIYNDAFDELFSSNIEDLSIRIIEEMKDDCEIGRFLSQKSEQKVIDIKKLIANNKLNALSGYLNILNVEQLKSVFNELNDQDKIKLVKCLDLSEVAYSVVKNTDYEEKYWSKFDRFYNQKDRKFEKIAIDNLIKYNPMALVSYYAYDRGISYEDKILLLESLVGNNEIGHNNLHNMYYIETLVKQLDNQYYDERLINAELGLLQFLITSSNDYPKGIKRFFLETPLYLYQFLKACSLGNFGDQAIAVKVLADCTISIGGHVLVSIELIRKDLEETYNYNINANAVNKKESLLERWFNNILSELNEEKDDKTSYIVESLLVLVLSLSFSYDVNNQYDYIIAILLEKLGSNKNSEDKRKISGKFYTSKFNSQGVRSVGDGSNESLIADNYLALSEKYKIEYPIISNALKTLSDSFYSMSNQDKKRKILGDF
ncbi:MAG: hypothetical protein PHP65_00150 [Bacilli bacterium]|nr:hypothetical protein [Bacilli bacterium]